MTNPFRDANVMTLRANFQKSYLWRYLAMAGIGLFMAIWFAFDGLIGYPREQERCAAYEQLAKEVSDTKERLAKWRELAKSKGWSVDTPKDKAAEFENKITGQYIFGALCLLLAIPALMTYVRSKNKWVESTGNGLTTSWGQSLQFGDVFELDKKRWANKGIAKAYYKHEGREKCFVFDDFKFDRQPLGEFLKQLEAVLQPEQIVGGPPESMAESNQANTSEENSPA
jgi:hypothetical protein